MGRRKGEKSERNSVVMPPPSLSLTSRKLPNDDVQNAVGSGSGASSSPPPSGGGGRGARLAASNDQDIGLGEGGERGRREGEVVRADTGSKK
jgi:hypothetical protein